MDAEGVRALVVQAVALLGDHGGEEDLAGVHVSRPSPRRAAAPPG